MRDRLIGYALGALERDEHEELQDQLDKDSRLREELEVVRRALTPLEADREPHDPPPGLASSTCRKVAALRVDRLRDHRGALAAASDHYTGSRPFGWSLVDLAVAAGIVLAAGALFFPAVNHSRFNAQVASCQSNLAGIGQALHRFSAKNPSREFPAATVSDKLSAAGLYAPQLLDKQYVNDPKIFFCGGAASDEDKPRKIPTLIDLNAAGDDDLKDLLGRAGGSYGYSLGHLENGAVKATRYLGRTNFPIMADAPCPKLDYEQSSNHGGYGQNVLFEDGHVRYLTSCRQPPGCPDLDFFRNDDGRVSAGKNADDAVIGCSLARPQD